MDAMTTAASVHAAAARRVRNALGSITPELMTVAELDAVAVIAEGAIERLYGPLGNVIPLRPARL
ncbi:hypothetical protein NJB18001_44750 [Mycobacterium marinum]|nr:hypothetical protein NJB18001_44750 [Mycobacterium marinum]